MWCHVEEVVMEIARPETPQQHASLFPKLNDAQLAQLAASGVPRHAEAGEILFDQGSSDHGIFVVLKGSIEVLRRRERS